MNMDWVESRIYVKPSYTGVVNSTNSKLVVELTEKAYLDGYEDARKDFMSCIENFHKEVVTQDETKNPFAIIGTESCDKCRYEDVATWMNPCAKCKHLHLCGEKDFWTPKNEDRNETIKVGDEVIAKLPSRKDPFKGVVIKIDNNATLYQFCIIDREGYTFWVSKEYVKTTGKVFPISDMLAQLDRDSGMEGKE